MQKKQIVITCVIAAATAIIALLISSALFGNPIAHKTKVPDVPTIPSSFPDIRNDPAYSSFLNNRALDPALPVKVGDTQNKAPFNTGR